MENNNNKNKNNTYNLSDTSSLKSINNNNQIDSYSQDSHFINKSLQDLNEENNNKNNNNANSINYNDNNEGSVVIKDKENNDINFGEENGSMIIYDNNDNNESNNKNNELNEGSMIIKKDDDEINNSIQENKIENFGGPYFMKYIENEDFIYDDDKYLEIMKKRQLQEMREKRELLEKKKKQKEEEKKRKEENETNNNNNKLICLNDIIEYNETNPKIQTPYKNTNNSKNSNNINNNDKDKDNKSINENNYDDNSLKINKYYTDFKINKKINSLLIKEERENKENIEQRNNNNPNQRSCITSNFTQTNSKTDSSDGKNNLSSNRILNSKINNVVDINKNPSTNKYNCVPLRLKLNFEDDNKQDTSNIDESDSEEEKMKPIRKCLVNMNYEDNKLQKSFEIREKKEKTNIFRTEYKQNRKNFLEKIKFSENVYADNFNMNSNNINEEDDFKSIHISYCKPHKKYFG